MIKKLRAFSARFSVEEKKDLTSRRVQRVWKKAGILFLLFLGLIIVQHYPVIIEKYYSNGIFPVIATMQRIVTGWVPFSLGDLLYFIVAVWLLFKLFSIFKGKYSWQGFFYSLGKFTYRLLALYIVFNLVWGLNYFRQGIGKQLEIIPEKYSTEELEIVTRLVSEKLNIAKKVLIQNGVSNVLPSDRQIFNASGQAYSNAQKKFKFLQYKKPSIKSSMYGKLGNYLGFLGYYNPFTGEAQVNVTPPKFVLPFITCHEIGHQAGYASEGEANFAGYLAAKHSHNKLFIYSVYFDLYAYASNELYRSDSLAAKNISLQLDPGVKNDIHTYRSFLRKYKNPFEPYISRFYGSFLKANNQHNGIKSYNEVIAWLVAYHKKYGEI